MVNFSFLIHNHQPVGNFDSVIREAYEKSYKPFIETLWKFPEFKFSIHFSGVLYDWLLENEKEYLLKIKEMVKRGQVEILSGGYYEPILSIIPEKDRLEQIKKMNDFIEDNFSFRPRGLWLTERVWEQELAKTIFSSGLEYTVVDDTHLISAGIPYENLNNYFLTEYDNKIIKIFPINHKLRYMIPFNEPFKSVEYLSSLKGGISLMADDGEKFGLWPKTYKLVYEEKWLENFINLILSNQNIKMVLLCDYLKSSNPYGIVYLPTASYHELSQWALPCELSNKLEEKWKTADEETKIFLRGGIFKNFFTKYPESNLMHKRMLDVSKKANEINHKKALEYVYKAQCNCGYWHGVFGGIYLPHIRMAVYENILKAQAEIFEDYYSNKTILEEKDINCDGVNEVLVENKDCYFVFSPIGGAMLEWSIKKEGINFSSIVNRRKEAYHLKNPRDISGSHISEKEKKEIIYDWHLRYNLLDHFFHPSTTIENFYRASYGEQGDFIFGKYNIEKSYSDLDAHIKIQREGFFWLESEKIPVTVEKNIFIENNKKWKAYYKIKNCSGKKVPIFFGTELVFAFSDKSIGSFRKAENISEYIFDDRVRGKLILKVEPLANLWIFPVETISNSEQGLEVTYQGSVVVLNFNREVDVNSELAFSFEVLHE